VDNRKKQVEHSAYRFKIAYRPDLKDEVNGKRELTVCRCKFQYIHFTFFFIQLLSELKLKLHKDRNRCLRRPGFGASSTLFGFIEAIRRNEGSISLVVALLNVCETHDFE